MASLLKRPLVATSLALLIVTGTYARTLFFTRGDLRYMLVQTWGSEGSEPGEFKNPVGVAIGPSGDIYVTDTGNNRIQRFRPAGAFVAVWGEGGNELGQLDRPMHAVFGPDGYLYVAEYLNDRIQIFTEGGKAVRALGTSGTEPGTFDAPGGVAVALNSDVYVADFFNHRAHRLDAGGDIVGILGTSGRATRGALHYPTDLATLPDGGVVVADAYNNRIQIFEPDGSFRRKWVDRSASAFLAGGRDGSASQPVSRLDPLVASMSRTFITTESRCFLRLDNCSAWWATLATCWGSSSARRMLWLPRTAPCVSVAALALNDASAPVVCLRG